MSLLSDFKSLMNVDITVQNVSSGGLYEPTYDTPTVYKCYISNDVNIIHKDVGKNFEYSAKIYLDGNVNISKNSKITIGEWHTWNEFSGSTWTQLLIYKWGDLDFENHVLMDTNDKTPIILGIDDVYDENGNIYAKIVYI